MSVIDIFSNKKNNSIYGKIKDCSINGKLDEDRLDELLNPQVEGCCKINAAFLDGLAINSGKRGEQVPRIMEVIEDVHNGKINGKALENKLKEINFKTLNVIDEIRARITSDNYNLESYETFKNLMYSAEDKEVFKFSLEMTGLFDKCEELINDYVLIGQSEEFSRYISFILCIWKEKTEFLSGLFSLLDMSENWGAINYGQMLMADSKIISDIGNQRKILIGTLSNNCIQMEVAFQLIDSLNVKELMNIAYGDEELATAIIDLYKTLLFERQPCGGILDLKDSKEYIRGYIDYLEECKFEVNKFIGVKDICDFLRCDDNKEEIIKEYNADIYGEIRERAESLLKNMDLISSLKKTVKSGDKYMYDAVNFIEYNQMFELIPNLEQAYLEGSKCVVLESLLCKLGSDYVKKVIYGRLKENSFTESKEKLYASSFGEEYKHQKKINYKMDVLTWNGAHDYELFKDLINYRNPEIRVKALDVIKEDSYYIENKEVIGMVKDRLSDSPYYVRKTALDVCELYSLSITNEEKKNILNEIKEREGKEDSKLFLDFADSLKDIVRV